MLSKIVWSNKWYCLFLLLLIPGCTKKIQVYSNAFADKKKIPMGFALNRSFYILTPDDKNVLFVNEVKDKLADLLLENGYSIADKEQADYYLFFNFGLDSSNKTVSVPYYIPGETKTTSGSVYSSDGINTSYQDQTISSGTYVYAPVEVTVYNRHITMEVYDAFTYRNSKKPEQLWHIVATSSGDSSDLRLIMDYLLKTVAKNFGKDTKQTICDVWECK